VGDEPDADLRGADGESPAQVTKRTFAGQFFIDGGMCWQDTSGFWNDHPEHSITLLMGLHWRSPTKRKVLRHVATALVRNGNDWFSVDGDRWRVDYDKLRTAFKLHPDFEWLTGSAFVEPEYDTIERSVPFEKDKTEPHPLVTLAFERDTLQQTIETAEERRTRIFDSMDFHGEVVSTCRNRFVAGQADDAIFQCCLRINAIVQVRSGVGGMDGDALFGLVFRSDAPTLSFTPCSNADEKNEQDGVRLLFQGMARAIRNPRAHRAVGTDEVAAIEHLAFLSMLLRFLDGAK
jgi:uncharacterized protein (TIGR02391 family)